MPEKLLPDYQYVCAEGHSNAAHKPLTRCLVMIEGQPCEGPLTEKNLMTVHYKKGGDK